MAIWFWEADGLSGKPQRSRRKGGVAVINAILASTVRPSDAAHMSRPRFPRTLIVISLGLGVFFSSLVIQAAPDGTPDQAAELAFKEWKAGHTTNAITLISEAIRGNPKEARWWNLRAQMNALLGHREQTIDDLGQAIALEPQSRTLLQGRAEELFKAGRILEAVRDFDRVNEVEPRFAPYNWQRGIALYFAGRYSDGRKQFESHQTVNGHDVENAVWHFLCTAREVDLEQARKRLIPIDGDERIPLAEIHRLFAGISTPEKVIAAVLPEASTPEQTRQQRFYAHLYLALYFEASGERARMVAELKACQPLGSNDDFMSHVARVMASRIKPEDWKGKSPEPAPHGVDSNPTNITLGPGGKI